MHSTLSKKIFFLDCKTTPRNPYFFISIKVCSPIVGKSILKSCFFFGSFIKIPSEFFFNSDSIFFVPSLPSLAKILPSLTTMA